jgi:hypothetical protein
MPDQFQQRKISKLKSNERPVRLLFLDTETKIRTAKMGGDKEVLLTGWDEIFYGLDVKNIVLHRFDLGWTCFSRYSTNKGFVSDEWKLWDGTKQLCEYIENYAVNKAVLYVIGCNIFFDLQVSDFFYYFTKWGWILEFVYDKGVTYMLIIKKGNKRIKCISTTNYFPVSVERLGQFLNLPKLDIKFGSCLRYELVKYCRRDVEIIRKAIGYYLWFIDKHDLGRFSLSRASQALTAFRHSFMTKAIYLHKDKTTQDLEAFAYSGGRVEARFLGTLPKSKYVSLDVNSMYPYVMRKFKMPTKLLDFREQVSLSDLALILNKYACVASVLINTDEPAYAVKRFGKLIFPLGSFRTGLCSEGLKFALANNHLRCIEQLAIYSKDYIFTDYVNYFMKLKQQYSKEGNTFLREVSKYFLLYLYGKFAQQKEIITETEDLTFDGYYRDEIYDLVTGASEITTKMFNKKWTTFGREPAGCCFTAISAHVTEYARFHLYKLMKLVGVEKVLYCDTDSLKILDSDKEPLAKFIHPYKLGFLKIEELFEYFTIDGAKNYRTERIKRIKGVPTNAQQTDEYTYSYMSFMKQASHLRAQVTRYAIVKPEIKVVKPYYDKGKVLADGTIIPFTLSGF